MIAPLTLNVPSSIEFGSGKLAALPSHLKNQGRIFVLVDAPIRPKVAPLIAELEKAGKAVLVSTEVVPEPPFEALETLLAPVRAFAPDAVVGIGGGSAMDLAKLVAVLYDDFAKFADCAFFDELSGSRVAGVPGGLVVD